MKFMQCAATGFKIEEGDLVRSFGLKKNKSCWLPCSWPDVRAKPFEYTGLSESNDKNEKALVLELAWFCLRDSCVLPSYASNARYIQHAKVSRRPHVWMSYPNFVEAFIFLAASHGWADVRTSFAEIARTDEGCDAAGEFVRIDTVLSLLGLAWQPAACAARPPEQPKDMRLWFSEQSHRRREDEDISAERKEQE